MKKLLAIVLALAMAFTFAACGGDSATGTTTEGVLKVGMECAYAPFNWTQTDDNNGAVDIGNNSYAGGYDVAVAKKIADELGLKLEIVKTEWDGLLPSLTSGKIDMIIAGMSPTAERKQSIDFSDNYYTSDLVIVVKKDSPYAAAKSIQDFSGAKITGQLNTFHYTVLDQINGLNKQTAMEDFPAMTVAVQSGKIDGYVSERPGAISASTSNSDLVYVDFEGENGFQYDLDEVSIAVGVRKGSELTTKINEALAKISEEEKQSMMEAALANQPLAQ